MFRTCKHGGNVQFIQQENTVPVPEVHVLRLIQFDHFIYPQGALQKANIRGHSRDTALGNSPPPPIHVLHFNERKLDWRRVFQYALNSSEGGKMFFQILIMKVPLMNI